MYNMSMTEISVSEFRQKCLTLMDNLPAEGMVVTRHGHPIATVAPVRKRPADLIGSLPGLILDPDDDLLSTGERWDAES
jgi:antitoxin (DNA-binding transcriptional repressor) of toxin-antitoxin stability system